MHFEIDHFGFALWIIFYQFVYETACRSAIATVSHTNSLKLQGIVDIKKIEITIADGDNNTSSPRLTGLSGDEPLAVSAECSEKKKEREQPKENLSKFEWFVAVLCYEQCSISFSLGKIEELTRN